jgi:cell division protein FtsI (penicillin-binding protein 3)
MSIDSKVQFFAYQKLREAVLENKAKAGQCGGARCANG